MNVLVWYKRDLRVHDHPALTLAAGIGSVLPVHVVEPDLWAQTDVSARQWEFVAESLGNHEAIEVVGEAGDVLLMHPHLVHARSMNCSLAHRLAANRCFVLHAPKSIHTPVAGSFSPMERAIRNAIGLS